MIERDCGTIGMEGESGRLPCTGVEDRSERTGRDRNTDGSARTRHLLRRPLLHRHLAQHASLVDCELTAAIVSDQYQRLLCLLTGLCHSKGTATAL